MTATTTTSFEIDGVTVSTGDRISLEGELFTVTSIKGRWITLSNGSNISRADAADARAEYLEDEECLGDEIESEEFGDDDIDAAIDAEMAEEEAAEDEEAKEESHDIVKPEYRAIYIKTVSASGNRTYDNGDLLANILRGCSIETILNLCNALFPEKIGRWGHLNIGQRSMNARNAIRHSIKKGVYTEDFVIELANKISLRA